MCKGIIAPKIEISTKTTVEESLCTQLHEQCSAFVVNPKVVSSTVKARPPCQHQKKVCHSVGYHKSRKYQCGTKGAGKEKPRFQFRRAEQNLLGRKPVGLEDGDRVCKGR